MTIHNETDLLGLTRAEKKLAHWKFLQEKGITVITSEDEGLVYEVIERINYWTSQVNKYRTRIEKHIHEFEQVKDFWGFANWIAGVVETIKSIISSLTK